MPLIKCSYLGFFIQSFQVGFLQNASITASVATNVAASLALLLIALADAGFWPKLPIAYNSEILGN